MKGEIIRIINKYFSDVESEVMFYGQREYAIETLDFFKNLVPYDHPDGYSVLNGDLLIVEHFEFDSSKNSRGGSQQRTSDAKGKREFSETLPSIEGTESNWTIDAEYSMQNYKKNFEKVFSSHYSKIDNYKESLIAANIVPQDANIRTMFFVEDTTLLGNVYRGDSLESPCVPVILQKCDFFLDLFEKSPKLDCVMSASFANDKYWLWYIGRNMIAEYRKRQIITNDINIINFTPHTKAFKLLIPNK